MNIYMFRCPDCKKWFVSSKTTITEEYHGNIVQIVNVPVKQCPNCGKLYIEAALITNML